MTWRADPHITQLIENKMANFETETAVDMLITAQTEIRDKLLIPFQHPCVELDELGRPIESTAITALAFATHQLAEVLRLRTFLEMAESSATVSYSSASGYEPFVQPPLAQDEIDGIGV